MHPVSGVNTSLEILPVDGVVPSNMALRYCLARFIESLETSLVFRGQPTHIVYGFTATLFITDMIDEMVFVVLFLSLLLSYVYVHIVALWISIDDGGISSDLHASTICQITSMRMATLKRVH
jgi:hypothetical protein